SRGILYPVRSLPQAPVELSLVALFDESITKPEEVFPESHLHELLFHLRGAALRQNHSQSKGEGEEGHSKNHSQASLTEVGAALTTALNLEDLSRLILDVSAKLVGAHHGTIKIIEGQDEVQSFTLQRNARPKVAGHLSLPIARHGRLKALLT